MKYTLVMNKDGDTVTTTIEKNKNTGDTKTTKETIFSSKSRNKGMKKVKICEKKGYGTRNSSTTCSSSMSKIPKTETTTTTDKKTDDKQSTKKDEKKAEKDAF